jgi:hypothetical protein
MAKKRKKNSNYNHSTYVPPQPDQSPAPKTGPKRMAVKAIRWSAWIVLLSVLLTQLTGNNLEDTAAISMFVISGLLYAISAVLERKYKW